MQLVLKPVNDPATPYGETLFPMFYDSLDDALARSAELLRINELFDKHKLVQVFIGGSRSVLGYVKLDKSSNEALWEPSN